MSESSEKTLCKILVALDTSPFGWQALSAAADLAAELSGELQALFVEDVNLLRLAGLPFAREVAFSSAVVRNLNVEQLERTLRAQADEVRKALEDTARRVRVQCSFQVARGHMTRESLAASKSADLLIIGRENPELRSVAPTPGARQPLLIVYDGSAASQRVLAMAVRLAREDEEIVVLTVAENDEQAAALRRACEAWLANHQVTYSSDLQVVTDVPALLAAARTWNARLLVINRDSSLLRENAVESLVNHLICPLGLVR